jgi:beta-barrel assembly-enhancing protease
LSTHPATSDRITALKSEINSQTAYKGGGLNNAAYEAKIQPLS